MKKEQKGFFEDLRDRNVWREVKADEDYFYSNMAKATAKEWGVEIPSN